MIIKPSYAGRQDQTDGHGAEEKNGGERKISKKFYVTNLTCLDNNDRY